MKMILFASALALSTAAMAQDATPATPGPTTPQADSTAPATPDSSAPAAAPMAPDASTPPAAPDATSAPTMAPTADATAGASSTDDSNLPMCSKTVTDKCKQGGKSSGHAHKKMHHKKS